MVAACLWHSCSAAGLYYAGFVFYLLWLGCFFVILFLRLGVIVVGYGSCVY